MDCGEQNSEGAIFLAKQLREPGEDIVIRMAIIVKVTDLSFPGPKITQPRLVPLARIA